jgi:hypothetical protein
MAIATGMTGCKTARGHLVPLLVVQSPCLPEQPITRQVDLDTLTAELLAVVDQTMQPIQASLWLRPQGPSDAIPTRVDAPMRS